MGVADIAAQLAIRQKEGNQKAMDDLSNMVKMERFKRLGKQFMDIGDYSPQGIQRFAQGNGVGIDEMQGLIQLVVQFQKLNQQGEESMPFQTSNQGIFDRRTGKITAPFSSSDSERYSSSPLGIFSNKTGEVKVPMPQKDTYESTSMSRTMPDGSINTVTPRSKDEEKAFADQGFKYGTLANLPKSPNDGQDLPSSLDPETIKFLAQKYSMTGELPPLGIGKNAASAKMSILNQARSDASASGTNAVDQTIGQSGFKASQDSLKALQRQQGLVLSFAETADKNLDLVLDLSKEVDRTGAPLVNKWLLSGKRALAGDVATAKFDSAVRTAINEFAKVTSTATGGGVTSDAARKEVESMLNSAQTPEQIIGVVETLKKEMANRKAGYNSQISAIKDSMSKSAGGGNIGGNKQTVIEPRKPGESVGDYIKRAGLQ